jgi:anti-sigma factor RsiW
MKRLFRRAHRPMSCAQVGKLLQFYLDGQLDPVRSARLRDHLEDCRRCGLEAATYDRLKATLAAQAEPADGDPVLDRLRDFATRLAAGELPEDER